MSDISFLKNIHLFLKKSRMAAGLTQKDMAEKLRVSESTISRWERGGDLPMEKVHRWFEACEILIRMTISAPGTLPLEEICSKCGEEFCTSRRLLKGTRLLESPVR